MRFHSADPVFIAALKKAIPTSTCCSTSSRRCARHVDPLVMLDAMGQNIRHVHAATTRLSDCPAAGWGS